MFSYSVSKPAELSSSPQADSQERRPLLPKFTTKEIKNIGSHICWLLVSLETQEISREESTRKSSSRRLVSRLSWSTLTKTTLCPPDLLSMTSISRIWRKTTLRLLKPELLPEKKLERDSPKLTETCLAPRQTRRLTTWDTSSTDLDSEHFILIVFELIALIPQWRW